MSNALRKIKRNKVQEDMHKIGCKSVNKKTYNHASFFSRHWRDEDKKRELEKIDEVLEVQDELSE